MPCHTVLPVVVILAAAGAALEAARPAAPSFAAASSSRRRDSSGDVLIRSSPHGSCVVPVCLDGSSAPSGYSRVGLSASNRSLQGGGGTHRLCGL